MKPKVIDIPVTNAAATRFCTFATQVTWRSNTPLAVIGDWCKRHDLQIVWSSRRRSLVIVATL